MSLSLPPRSLLRCDEQNAQLVHEQLTSVIAGHPQATPTYRFYEEIDHWLGPWGTSGYPIGYGKFYNVAFSDNQHLKTSPAADRWVRLTAIYLQEALRDYIVERIRNCTIATLTEPQLRQAAFDSHPQAYDRAGLATVVLAAPELIPIIATIPSAEFSPTSDSFGATIEQVYVTLGLIAPKVLAGTRDIFAGLANTDTKKRALEQAQQQRSNEMAIPQELGRLKRLINEGKLDHVPCLTETIAQLNARQFPGQVFARLAREVIQVAEARKRKLLQDYDHLLIQSPEVRARINKKFPNRLCSGL